MLITEKRTEVILTALQDKHCAEWCSAYGEPGYSDPERGVIFANWNDVGDKIGDYLEEAGFDLCYSDEWLIDYNHDKAYRTQPDSYSWQSSILYTENGDPLTPDDPADEWIDELAITDQAQSIRCALPSFIDDEALEAEGFQKLDEDHESGWYGREDDPQEIAIKLWNEIEDLDRVVFRLSGVGQFAVRFETWYQVAEGQITDIGQGRPYYTPTQHLTELYYVLHHKTCNEKCRIRS